MPVTTKRVRTDSATSGTGAYVFIGNPFGTVLSVGGTGNYSATDFATGVWESGVGTLEADGSLTRTSIQGNSNGDNLPINWPVGSRDIAVTVVSDIVAGGGAPTGGLPYSPQITLPFATTIDTDAAISQNFAIEPLTANITLNNPTNLAPGMTINWRIKQDNTGGRTVTYGSLFKFSFAVIPSLTGTANSVDLLTAYFDGLILISAITPDPR